MNKIIEKISLAVLIKIVYVGIKLYEAGWGMLTWVRNIFKLDREDR